MKQFNIFLFFFFICASAIAQEKHQLSIVYLQDGSMIKGQVFQDYAQSLVTIKILDGTELVIPRRTVKSIIKLKDDIALLKSGKYIQTTGLYKLLTMGTLTAWEGNEKQDIVWGASLLNVNIGYQFNQYLAVGGGFGMEFYDKEYFPVYVDFRGYILNKGVSPYYAFQAGYGISTDIFNEFSNNITFKGGAMLSPSIGIRFASFQKAKFILEAGYKFQYDTRINSRSNLTDKLVFKRLALKFGVLF